MTTELEGLLKAIRTEPAEPLHRFALADWLDDNPHHTTVPLTADFLRRFSDAVPMSRVSFQELCGDACTNDNFLHFAGVLELEGRSTQAELIRAALRLRDDLTPTERTLLGVPDAPDQATLDRLTERHARLQNQFIVEHLGPDIAEVVNDTSYPPRLSMSRGVIESLSLSGTPILSLPEGLQVLRNLDVSETGIAALPNDLQVGVNIELNNTQIARLPEGLQPKGNVNLDFTQITSLPTTLRVGGDLYLSGTGINELPENLQVAGRLDLGGTAIASDTAQQIARMRGLSTEAKVSGLQSAGYNILANQVERAGLRHGTDLPPL